VEALRKVVLFGLLGLVLVAGVLAGLYFTGRLGQGGRAEPVVMRELGEFITNLRGDAGRHFIRVRINVELAGKEAATEASDKSLLIRDTILAVLRSQHAQDLAGEEGMQRLRETLKERLSAVFERSRVVRVLFVEFVIQ